MSNYVNLVWVLKYHVDFLFLWVHFKNKNHTDIRKNFGAAAAFIIKCLRRHVELPENWNIYPLRECVWRPFWSQFPVPPAACRLSPVAETAISLSTFPLPTMAKADPTFPHKTFPLQPFNRIFYWIFFVLNCVNVQLTLPGLDDCFI